MTVILFFVVIISFLFFPVRFHFAYANIGVDDHFLLEMVFFHFIRWRKEVPLLRSRLEKMGVVAQVEEQDVTTEGKVHKAEVKWDIAQMFAAIQRFRRRLKDYGLGVTLASFFVPDKYLNYIRVINELENRGRFTRFTWQTGAGSSNPAYAAWLVGGLWAVKGEILGLLQSRYRFFCRPSVHVQPEFGRNVLDTKVDCIFQVKLGQIMLAGIKEYTRRLLSLGRGGKSD